MNQRIKELAEQATLKWAEEVPGGVQEMEFFDKEKFAELIVKECSARCDEYAASLVGDTERGNAEKTTAYMLGDDIREHFGVE